MSTKHWTKEDIPNLHGKNIIVTGGNSGLGYESVKTFAEKGANVILASRSVEKGEEAKQKIGSVNGRVNVMPLDLQNFESVEKFAEAYKAKYDSLHVLLNNAGIMITPYFKTKEGLEGQTGTNHFGHFKLTAHLLDVIKNTPGARVVNVSSTAHRSGKMDFDNLMFEKGAYSSVKSYGRAKLENLLFTYELQRFFEAGKIDAIAAAAHPGASQTNLDRYLRGKFWFKLLFPLLRLMMQPAVQGAMPQIRACTDPRVKGGEYYGPNGFRELKGHPVRVESNALSHNKEDAKKLWAISEQLTGVKF